MASETIELYFPCRHMFTLILTVSMLICLGQECSKHTMSQAMIHNNKTHPSD